MARHTKTLVFLVDELYGQIGTRDALTAKSGLVGARATLVKQFDRINMQIKKVEQSLDDCVVGGHLTHIA